MPPVHELVRELTEEGGRFFSSGLLSSRKGEFSSWSKTCTQRKQGLHWPQGDEMLSAWSHCYHGAFSYFPGHVASSSLSSSPTVFFFFLECTRV